MPARITATGASMAPVMMCWPMVAMSVEPHTKAAANSASSMDGSMSTLMSSSRTPPIPA